MNLTTFALFFTGVFGYYVELTTTVYCDKILTNNEQRRSFVYGITEYKGVFYSVYSARTDGRVILLPITVKAGVS